MNAGVTQISVLGPTLRNIYINDIPRSTDATLALYADFSAILSTVHHYFTLKSS